MNDTGWRGEGARLLVAAGLLLAALIGVYSNHFRNDFAFDDSHTIVNNVYIRDLGNIPKFFTDATTFSSNPSNQMYRPLFQTTLAIDYRLAGNRLDPLYFQADTFVWYVLQLVAMFFFIQHLFAQARPHRWNRVAALAATAFYGFHAANAETVNYVSARSDALSTFWLIVSLLAYVKLPGLRWRGLGLFLLPLLLGLLTKQAVLVFPGLLYLYVLMFEGREPGEFSFKRMAGLFINPVLPSLLLCGTYYAFQGWMTPPTFTPGGGSRFAYMITQPYVTLHYFMNFLAPVNLSADTDLGPLPSILDWRFAVGVLFVAAALMVAWFAHRVREWRPVSFGILWFFTALLPTSSIIPFAEVLNDHRTYFPYIGLVIALCWSLTLLLYQEDARRPLEPFARYVVLGACALVLGLHGAGAHARNEVWRDGESLWTDAVQKSPLNGRAWMNLGVAQMSRGEWDTAEQSFGKALELWPQYSYAHVNMAILKSARGRKDEADAEFRKAIEMGPAVAGNYFFYGRFLADNGRLDEAIQALETNVRLSPANLDARYLLLSVYEKKGDREKLRALANDTLKLIPGDTVARNYLEKPVLTPEQGAAPFLKAIADDPSPKNYVGLSFYYYQQKLFEKAIDAAQGAVKKDPGYLDAWINICAAQNSLGRFDEGIKACEKAVALDPQSQLARNNLAWARSSLRKQ